MSCTAAAHDLMRASGVAFRAQVRLTFRFWSVDDAGRDEEAHAGNCERCGSTIAIPVRLLAAINAHEAAARALKVGKMLALVPMGATRREMDDLADVLVWFDGDARARWARAAGCRTAPSLATWADLVAASRGRLTAEEIYERAMAPEMAEVR